jgi:DNA invertase Pin-like site-specific DNA recombinase
MSIEWGDHAALARAKSALERRLTMLGVFAEFERSMIVARVKAGLERAKATGTRTGNPFGRPVLSSRKT